MKRIALLIATCLIPVRYDPKNILRPQRRVPIREVWGYQNYPCTRTVDNHILKLRKKLETNPAEPRHFLTIHCVGYKFAP